MSGVQRSFQRHVFVAVIASAFGLLFWWTRLDWDPEMRLWRAVGDASLMLLYLTLMLGPMVRLQPRLARLSTWRREFGIWFALLATVHTVLILVGWIRWDPLKLVGLEFVPNLERYARTEPGFGLANIVGVVALLWSLLLMATSSDLAIRRLGGSSWKWLHNAANTVFYLVALHTAYFLFIHFEQTFHREPPPLNWFRLPFLVLTVLLMILQFLAFRLESRNGRRKNEDSDSDPGPDTGSDISPMPPQRDLIIRFGLPRPPKELN